MVDAQKIQLEYDQLIAIVAAMTVIEKHDITSEMDSERLANPHGDAWKKRRRSSEEIHIQLKVARAKRIVDEAYKQTFKSPSGSAA